MKLFRFQRAVVLKKGGDYFQLADEWDHLVNREDLFDYLEGWTSAASDPPPVEELLPPVQNQEVWAAGVTYLRSRDARKEESEGAGGGDFYERVYWADRPELFMKAAGFRVKGHRDAVRIRRDSMWNVPEPELAVLVNAAGEIVGYTIGNDMSSRDIEGENPLYLPQAKVYDGSCALGPGVLISKAPLLVQTEISLQVFRGEEVVLDEKTDLGQMKRTIWELVDYLYRECSFPAGCYLMTGTGVVPPASFSLRAGDLVRISIDPIGTLENRVDEN